jgi:hypothetical protein
MKRLRVCIQSVMIAAVVLSFGPTARGALSTLYFDDFQSPNDGSRLFDDTGATGQSPSVIGDASLAGNFYQGRGNSSADPAIGLNAAFPAWEGVHNNGTVDQGATGVANLFQDIGAALPFRQDPEFATIYSAAATPLLRLSATVNFGTLTDNITRIDRGIGLGFWSTSAPGAAGANARPGFSGLMLSTAGQVKLTNNSQPTPLGPAAFVTGFNTTAGLSHTFQYDLEPATGTISNVVVDGIPVLFFNPTATNLATATANSMLYTGFILGANAAGQIGSVDNFRLEWDPLHIPTAPCDVSRNGVCNFTDAIVIRDNIGKTGLGSGGGDIDGSGVVDLADWRLLRDDPLFMTTFDGGGAGAVSPFAVPEPSSAALLGVSLLVNWLCARRAPRRSTFLRVDAIAE